jgi:hypothetical protein
MRATVCLCSVSEVVVCEDSRRREFSASSRRFCRTRNQGDSGQYKPAMKSGMGQIHCTAKGMR